MMIQFTQISDYREVYDYCLSIREAVPYWFETDYDLWKQSFLSDCDYDGQPMFRRTQTWAATREGKMVGFIQFGIPSYLYDTHGEKSDAVLGGVIRMLYFDSDSGCGEGLIRLAEAYFARQGVQRKFAFFHAFGMSCYAGHGKLHVRFPHIEKALLSSGYEKEHENVYYVRTLSREPLPDHKTLRLAWGERNQRGLQEFSVFDDETWVGAGAVVFLPQGELAYLKWIFIDGAQQGKGYGTAALGCLFAQLEAQGIRRLDTDTADGNLTAQHLYTKMGLRCMGRTRSYQCL